MLSRRDDPILALATPPGRGAVGVVRISGASLQLFVQQLAQRALNPRQATLLTLRDAHAQQIDQVLAIFFPAPHSYTGEDVLELQGHGGPAVLHMVLQHCLEVAQSGPMGKPCLPNLRLAEPGEFTRRAYDEATAHGKPRILLSAHGLPKKTIAGGDPYQWQVEQTAGAGIAQIGRAHA